MAIHCCNGCVPPKRTPTCHFDGSCMKYIEAKAKHDAEMAQARKIKEIQNSIYEQKTDGVLRAHKRKR